MLLFSQMEISMNFGEKKQIKYPSKMKILLEYEKGLSPIYKQWAKEAVSEFINLFPSQKDLFEILEPQQNAQLLDAVLAKHPKGTVNLSNLNMLYQAIDKNNAIQYKVGILHSMSESEIGMGGGNCVIIAASNIGMKKKFFKNIVKHELGHVFGAVSREHNCVDVMGRHCNDYSCVMSLGAYTEDGHQKFDDNQLFCKDCMNDMQKYVQELQTKCRGFSFGKKQDKPTIHFGEKKDPATTKFYFEIKQKGGLGE